MYGDKQTEFILNYGFNDHTAGILARHHDVTNYIHSYTQTYMDEIYKLNYHMLCTYLGLTKFRALQ